MRTISRVLTILVATAATITALAGPAQAASSAVSLKPILRGYDRPVLVAHAPGGGREIFIVEQSGRIERATYRNGRWIRLGTFLDLSSLVNDPGQAGNGERGLLGLAFHPRYRTNGRLYVYYTRRTAGSGNGDAVVAEYRRRSASRAAARSRRVLMVIDQPASNHNGGHLAFGPDGLLYIGTGDGGGAGDPDRNGQDLRSRLGKILRLDPRDPDGAGPRRYRTPASNPRVGKRGLDVIWAWGLRNPWRFSFDRARGDLWIGDVGQGAREEIDRSRADARGKRAGRGVNYGWNRCEGRRRYPDTAVRCGFGTLPVNDYRHGPSRCSVTGGYVYRGPYARAWRGLYIGADFCGRLFVLDRRGRVRLSRDTDHRISAFGEDARGRLYATDLADGTIYRVRFRGPRP